MTSIINDMWLAICFMAGFVVGILLFLKHLVFGGNDGDE